MTKSELIAVSAEKAGITKKDAEKLLNAALQTIAQTLEKGESVSISGFGIFEVKNRSPRTGRNPVTGETIRIQETKVPAFRPSQSLKEQVEVLTCDSINT